MGRSSNANTVIPRAQPEESAFSLIGAQKQISRFARNDSYVRNDNCVERV